MRMYGGIRPARLILSEDLEEGGIAVEIGRIGR